MDPKRSRICLRASSPAKRWSAGDMHGILCGHEVNALRKFLAHMEGNRLYALWLLASSTGMRRGELLGIQWSDVDLGRARISVRRSLVTVGHEVVVSGPKTAKGRRSVALDPATVAGLKAWRKHQAAALVFGRDQVRRA